MTATVRSDENDHWQNYNRRSITFYNGVFQQNLFLTFTIRVTQSYLALRISLAKISFTSDWYGNPFFSAVLRNQPKTFVSKRIAMSIRRPITHDRLPADTTRG